MSNILGAGSWCTSYCGNPSGYSINSPLVSRSKRIFLANLWCQETRSIACLYVITKQVRLKLLYFLSRRRQKRSLSVIGNRLPLNISFLFNKNFETIQSLTVDDLMRKIYEDFKILPKRSVESIRSQLHLYEEVDERSRKDDTCSRCYIKLDQSEYPLQNYMRYR